MGIQKYKRALEVKALEKCDNQTDVPILHRGWGKPYLYFSPRISLQDEHSLALFIMTCNERFLCRAWHQLL